MVCVTAAVLICAVVNIAQAVLCCAVFHTTRAFLFYVVVNAAKAVLSYDVFNTPQKKSFVLCFYKVGSGLFLLFYTTGEMLCHVWFITVIVTQFCFNGETSNVYTHFYSVRMVHENVVKSDLFIVTVNMMTRHLVGEV